MTVTPHFGLLEREQQRTCVSAVTLKLALPMVRLPPCEFVGILLSLCLSQKWDGGGVFPTFCLKCFMLCLFYCFAGSRVHNSSLLSLLMHPSISPESGGITFASWNVRGLGHVHKRAKVFSLLKSLSADILFLQETHIRPSSAKLLVEPDSQHSPVKPGVWRF